jgi:hypothetical protein
VGTPPTAVAASPRTPEFPAVGNAVSPGYGSGVSVASSDAAAPYCGTMRRIVDFVRGLRV